MKKSNIIQIYFYSILLASIFWILILPKPIKNFGPIIFVIPTFPVFIYLYINKLYDFSKNLKIEHPVLFRKYVVDNGYALKGEVVQIGLSDKIDDFEKLEDKKLYEKYILCREYIKMAFISFLIFGILGIATVYL